MGPFHYHIKDDVHKSSFLDLPNELLTTTKTTK